MSGRGVRVALVDDHALLREGIREILATQADFEIVGEAGDSEGALELVSRSRPDVVLLDVEIVGGPVTATVQRMAAASPETRVVILSMSDPPDLIRELLPLGIRGYLLKSVSRHELVSVVRAARPDSDRVVLSISRESLIGLADRGRTKEPDERLFTDREEAVLRLTASAHSNAQIATRLGLSEATVKRHLRHIFAKLGAVSRIDAVNKGVALGLLEAPTRAEGADARVP
jgi:DNA-binding NarL/FixJ family response regulator